MSSEEKEAPMPELPKPTAVTATKSEVLSTAIAAPLGSQSVPAGKPSHLLPFSDPSTLAVHADSHLPGTSDVAPPIHLSTTFEYTSDPEELIPARDQNVFLFLTTYL